MMPIYFCYFVCLLPMVAHAHEAVKTERFLPLLSMGGRYLHSENYPIVRLNNVLEANEQVAYQQKNAIDYADVGLQIQLTRNSKTLLNASYHGPDLGDTWELEQLWWHYQADISQHRLLDMRVGRQNVAIGRQNSEHSHTWLMGVEPLVMRASVADGWRDDGIAIQLSADNTWLLAAGIYKGNGFPSNKDSGFQAGSAKLGWQQHNHYIEASLAHFEVTGRGTTQQTQGHSHQQPSCEQVTTSVVCFRGKSQLAVLAAQWDILTNKLAINGELWLKKEQGTLLSQTGQVDYTGLNTGGWLMLDYQITPQWRNYIRAEKLYGAHDLLGANAALIATDAGISNSEQGLSRIGAGMTWQMHPAIRLSLEAHQEKTNQAQKTHIVLMRYQIDLWKAIQAFD